MEKRTKIIIIGIVCAIGATWFLWLPITLMIFSGMFSSFVTSITSDDAYVKRASQNPTVNQYIESYPDYSTSQYNEFLGWRVIHFDVKDGPSMYVKVSNLHGGIKVSAACPMLNSTTFHPNATLAQQIVTRGC